MKVHLCILWELEREEGKEKRKSEERKHVKTEGSFFFGQ